MIKFMATAYEKFLVFLIILCLVSIVGIAIALSADSGSLLPRLVSIVGTAIAWSEDFGSLLPLRIIVGLGIIVGGFVLVIAAFGFIATVVDLRKCARDLLSEIQSAKKETDHAD